MSARPAPPLTATSRARWLCGAALALSLLVSAGPAGAFCRIQPPRLWANADGIPVFLNTHLEQFLCHGDCRSFDDLRRVTQIALAKIFDESGARVRFVYNDTTRNFNDRIDGAIHITLRTDTCDEGADADCEESGGLIKNCRLRFCANFEWSSFHPDIVTGKSRSYQGVLIHELLHALGLHHPERCGDTTASALSEGLGTLVATHLYEDDAVALRTLYGTRPQEALAFKSDDGIAWTTATPPPSPMSLAALHTPSGCGAGTDSPMVVSYTRRTGDRAVQFTRFDGIDWTAPAFLPGAATPYRTATACASATDQLIAWQGDYNQITGAVNLFASRTTDGGATWNTQRFGDTTPPGMAAAFDPASGRYITVVRTGGTGILVSQVLSDGPLTFHFLGGLDMRTAEAPSLACGPPAVVGERNCLLAWVSPNWDRFLWFAFGRVVWDDKTPRFDFDARSLYAAPIVMFGTPSVTFVPDPEFPWQLVGHQGEGKVIALKRAASHAPLWQPDPPAEFGVSALAAITSPLGASLSTVRAPSRYTFFLGSMGGDRSKDDPGGRRDPGITPRFPRASLPRLGTIILP